MLTLCVIIHNTHAFHVLNLTEHTVDDFRVYSPVYKWKNNFVFVYEWEI